MCRSFTITPQTVKKIIPYGIVLTFILAGAFFYFKGCKSGKSDVDILHDSLVAEIKANDSIKTRHVAIMVKVDSLKVKNTTDSLKFTKKIDSLQNAYTLLKSKLNGTKDSIFRLKSQLDGLANNIDNPQLKEVVSRLGDQLTDANNQLWYIQMNRDSATTADTAEITRLRGVVVELQGQVRALNDLLIQCTTNASNMSKTANSAIKKAKARGLLAKIGGGLAAVLGILLILK